jgi:hypothetical protein
MLIREVTAERARLHVIPAFSAGDLASIPIGSRCASSAHPEVGLVQEMEVNVAGRAGHRLRLLGVSLQTNTFKCPDETVDRRLEEGGVP